MLWFLDRHGSCEYRVNKNEQLSVSGEATWLNHAADAEQ
jgi:hypothetical protein